MRMYSGMNWARKQMRVVCIYIRFKIGRVVECDDDEKRMASELCENAVHRVQTFIEIIHRRRSR